MVKIKVKSLAEMSDFAVSFLGKIDCYDGRATIIALYGDLGSGKTTFTQSVAKAFGIKSIVTSPTFVIEKIYKLPKEVLKKNGFKHLIHIDAYRLNGSDELLSLGWNGLVTNPENIIFIEWPERVSDLISKEPCIKKLWFEFIDENTREVVFR
ncbi:tRNA (adenosine(37)-N6)-threonylcarbamoyltransferase complex ATPase subunit type 1 TsaE [Patescibacteria group bacterium]